MKKKDEVCGYALCINGKKWLIVDEKNGIELRIGGVGGAYFLAPPGELIIDIEKRDLNTCRGCHVDITLKDVETVQCISV